MSGAHTSQEHSFLPVWVNEGLPPCMFHRKKSDIDSSSLIKNVGLGTLVTFLTSHSGKDKAKFYSSLNLFTMT